VTSDSIRARSEGAWNIDRWPVITPQSDAVEAARGGEFAVCGPPFGSW